MIVAAHAVFLFLPHLLDHCHGAQEDKEKKHQAGETGERQVVFLGENQWWIKYQLMISEYPHDVRQGEVPGDAHHGHDHPQQP